MSGKKSKGINPELDAFIESLMKEAKAENSGLPLLDKLRIADRAIAIEKIKQKISDDEWGSGFLPPDDEDAA